MGASLLTWYCSVPRQVHQNGSTRGRYPHPDRVLDISRDQGSLEIHVESFKLTKEVRLTGGAGLSALF